MLIAHSVNGLATVSLFHLLFVNQLAVANHTHTQPSRLYVICIFRPFVLKPRSLDEGRMINELWIHMKLMPPGSVAICTNLGAPVV